MSLCTAGLAACGGGNDGGGGSKPATVTITGTTGKSVTLTANSGTFGNAAAIPTPATAPSHYNYPAGFFNFEVKGLATGASVKVTVELPAGTAPSDYLKCDNGGSCAPFAGASVSGNTITLTLVDGGAGDSDGVANGVISDPGAPAVTITDSTAYYLPFQATAFSTFTDQGVFVVPAGAPTTAPHYVSTDSVGNFSPFYRYLSNDAGAVYQSVPDSVLYQAGSGSFYKLDLSAASSLTPTRVGTLPLSSYGSFPQGFTCAYFSGQQNLADPATGFVLFSYAGRDSQCGTADDQSFLIHLSDSPSTPPVTDLPLNLYNGYIPPNSPVVLAVTSLTGASVATFYDHNGALDGIAGVDVGGGNLVFYKDLGLSTQTTLLHGVSSFYVLASGPDYAFLAVTQGTGQSLYRVDGAGTISAKLYDFQPSTDTLVPNYGTADPSGKILFFNDNSCAYADNTCVGDGQKNVVSYSDRLLSVPLDGSAPARQLFSSAGAAPPNTTIPKEVSLIGFLGSDLLFELAARSSRGHGAGNSATLYTLPIDAGAGTQPSAIASLANGYFGGYISGGRLFANAHSFNANRQPVDVTAEVLAADGSVVKSYPQSWFYGTYSSVGGTTLAPRYAVVNEILTEGYTDAAPGIGGAAVKNIEPAGLAETVFKTPDGAATTLPAGSEGFFDLYGSPVGGAALYGAQRDSSVILDITHNLWVPVVTNSGFVYPMS